MSIKASLLNNTCKGRTASRIDASNPYLAPYHSLASKKTSKTVSVPNIEDTNLIESSFNPIIDTKTEFIHAERGGGCACIVSQGDIFSFKKSVATVR